jgi:hypothetical protein
VVVPAELVPEPEGVLVELPLWVCVAGGDVEAEEVEAGDVEEAGGVEAEEVEAE